MFWCLGWCLGSCSPPSLLLPALPSVLSRLWECHTLRLKCPCYYQQEGQQIERERELSPVLVRVRTILKKLVQSWLSENSSALVSIMGTETAIAPAVQYPTKGSLVINAEKRLDATTPNSNPQHPMKTPQHIPNYRSVEIFRIAQPEFAPGKAKQRPRCKAAWCKSRALAACKVNARMYAGSTTSNADIHADMHTCISCADRNVYMYFHLMYACTLWDGFCLCIVLNHCYSMTPTNRWSKIDHPPLDQNPKSKP